MTALGAHHPRIQHLRRLARDRDAREESSAFVVEGPTLVAEAVRAGWPLEEVYVGEGVELDLDGVTPTVVVSGVLERVSTTVTPRPVVAVAHRPSSSVDQLRGATFVVVLDAISDPGNLGTIVRTAESAGADGVVVCGGVDPFNPKCVRASAGALFFVPVVIEPSAAVAIDTLRAVGLRVIGTSADAGRRYDEVDLRGPVAVVMGSESHGLAPDVASAADDVVSIPIVGASESLNVAAAAAVMCFEVARQRRSA